MKIIVDVMPDKPEKCKFHGKEKENGIYICTVTGKKCPMCEDRTCRVLKSFHDAVGRYLRG